MRQRLLNLVHARGQHMNLLLIRCALERLLYCLSLSPHRERFALKGAMMLMTWFDEPHRTTRGVDLLGLETPSKTLCTPPWALAISGYLKATEMSRAASALIRPETNWSRNFLGMDGHLASGAAAFAVFLIGLQPPD